MKPNRRELLKAAVGLSVLSLSGFDGLARSAGPAESLGVTSVSDGNLSFPLGFYLPNTPPDESAALLTANGLSDEAITPDCNVTLFRDGERTILFDTGAGDRFMASAGKLPGGLEALGIDPADVTDVVFTHAHPDHLWGVLDEFDDPFYPNATHHISQPEWDFWYDDGTVDAMPDAQKAFAVGAKRNLTAIEDKVVRFKSETEILPNVFAMDTSGHTPGHTSFEIRKDGERFLVIGDAIGHPVVSFQRPGWVVGTDQDPQKAIKARKALLDRMASEKIACLGYHLTAPGMGFAERHEGAYRFVPV